ESDCYREDTSAFFYTGEYDANHDIVLVGWDDSFGKNNFVKGHRPQNDGAWLVKNSWGEDWGDGGYFWVSYEDSCFPGYVTAYCGVDEWDPNMYVYETDYTSEGYEGEEKGEQFAKVFPTVGGEQSIESVRVMVPCGGLVTVRVDVIPDFESFEGYNFETCGARSIVYPGWYTIDLDEPVELAQSGSFAVVVRLEGASALGCDLNDAEVPADSYVWDDGEAVSCEDNWSIKAVARRAEQEDVYRVILHANFGVDVFTWKNAVKNQSVAIDWELPEQDACTFAGWNTKPDGSGTAYEQGASVSVTGDLTLYAQWESLTSYRLENGTLTVSGSGSMADYAEETDVPWYKDRLSIKAIVIKKGVTGIGDRAFCGCSNAKSVSIPESVQKIGKDAFTDCSSLQSVRIPKNVEGIAYDSFFNCTSLKNIFVAAGNEDYADIDGVLIDRSENTLVCFPAGREGEYTVPDGVEQLGNYSFANSGVTKVVLPATTRLIRFGAFWSCSELTRLEASGAVEEIGEYALQYCGALTAVSLPESLELIGEGAFSECDSLEDVYYVGSVEQWKEIEIEEDNEALEDAAFHFFGCGLCEIGYVGRLEDMVVAIVSTANGVRATAVCAVYDGSGRLISVETETLTPGRDNNVIFKNGISEGAEVKIFVLNGLHMPLCECAGLVLNRNREGTERSVPSHCKCQESFCRSFVVARNSKRSSRKRVQRPISVPLTSAQTIVPSFTPSKRPKPKKANDSATPTAQLTQS
ncbi:MAG: leucine-rich repeat protein, partial [Oscillospiraceae bacterium]|nr:leucine-rich repeat protein [Oscillospiraceae bacterium]